MTIEYPRTMSKDLVTQHAEAITQQCANYAKSQAIQEEEQWKS
jgi:hypothetical protein